MTTVLVAYASRGGATREIAEGIAAKLREFELSAECVAVAEVRDLDRYDAVVLGSAVYRRHWRHDGQSFVRRYADLLAAIPCWIFSSGPVGREAGAAVAPVEPAEAVSAAERLGARGHVVFPGRLPVSPHGPIERALVAATPPYFRDRRDWGAIRVWAAKIGAELSSAGPRQVGTRSGGE